VRTPVSVPGSTNARDERVYTAFANMCMVYIAKASYLIEH